MDESKTLYDVLEISESATQDEIKAAHRRLITEYHPDKIPEHLTRLRRDAEERTLKLQDAWRTLGNPASRRLYDETLRVLRAGATPAPQAQKPTPKPPEKPPAPEPPPPRPEPPPPAAQRSWRLPPWWKRGVIFTAAGTLLLWLAILGLLHYIDRLPAPIPFGSRLLTDELNGRTIGEAHGIRWDRGAVFSARDASRIEYPSQIPAEGTLEMWIKVLGGYRYADSVLSCGLDWALIFSTDSWGGDVTWPGATLWSVSRNGDVSFQMARHKYNLLALAPTEAGHTRFRFGEWHALGVSYGQWGQYLMVDGEVVASKPGRTQRMGAAGTADVPEDTPTIGETVSHPGPGHKNQGGFEGVVASVRISPRQQDWRLARGVVYGEGIPPDTGAWRDRICAGAADGEPHEVYLDLARKETDEFAITLTPGCFSGYLLIPENWKRYLMEPAGAGENWWLAYRWFARNSGSGQRPPLTAAELSKLGLHSSQKIRVQGNGRLVFKKRD